MGKKRHIIIVKGYVQMSGFRNEIERLANKHFLFGKIENLKNPSKDVQIDIEGKENSLKGFLKDLRALQKEKNKHDFKIRKILSKKQARLINYFSFEVIRKHDEISERLDEGIGVLIDIKGGFLDLHEKYHTINETMIEVSSTLKEVASLKSDIHELKNGINKVADLKSGINKLSALPGNIDRLNKNVEQLNKKGLKIAR